MTSTPSAHAAPTLDAPDSKAAEWRRHFVLLAAATSVTGLAALPGLSFGAVFQPLQEAFGWGRGDISVAYTLIGVGAILLNPIAGLLVSRYGSRLVGSIGLIAYAGALCLVGGFAGPELWTWHLAWLFVAIATPFTTVVIWSTPVVRAFRRNRGIALAIMTSSTGVTAALGPMLIISCVETWGWRSAYFAIAAILLFVALSIVRLFFFNRDEPASSPSAAKGTLDFSASLGQAAKTRRFWQLVIAVTLTGVVAISLFIHMQPMFIDAGADPQQAAAMISVLGVAMIIGRLVVGFLLDRLPGPVVGSATVMMLLPATLIMLNYDGSMVWGLIAAASLGFCVGGEYDVLAYFSTRYFDPRHYSVIFGTLFGVYSLASTLAPTIAGMVFDATGSYEQFLIMAAGFAALCVVLMATLGKYVYQIDE